MKHKFAKGIKDYNKKMNQGDNLRIWHRKKRKIGRITYCEGYTVKCGCCNGKIDIGDFESDLEINGVITSKENWRQFLIPLLEEEDIKIIVCSKEAKEKIFGDKNDLVLY